MAHVEEPSKVGGPVQWVPDYKIKRCMSGPRCASASRERKRSGNGAGVLFSTFTRKHHCRLCGEIFCAACAPRRRLSDELKGLPAVSSLRICMACFQRSRDPSTALGRQIRVYVAQREQLERGALALGAEWPAYTLTKDAAEEPLPNAAITLFSKPFCAMTMVVARLDIEIVRARGLEAMDTHMIGNNSSDPYVTLQVNDLKARSSTRLNTCDPVWNDTFRLTILNPHDSLRLRVYDEDNAAKKIIGLGQEDDFLGGLTIPLLAIKQRRIQRIKEDEDGPESPPTYVEGWFPLTKDKEALDRLSPRPPKSGSDSGSFGEIYLRLRLSSTRAGEIMSRFTLFPDSLMTSPVELPPLDLDVLYRNLNRCLAYLYPLLNLVSTFSDLLSWRVYWKSLLCLAIMVTLSLRTDLLPLFFHIVLLLQLSWNKAQKQMLAESLIRNQVLRGDVSVPVAIKAEGQMHQSGFGDKLESAATSVKASKTESDENEASMGPTVSALMLLCPGWLKETLRGAQATLKTVADALDMVHELLTWKNERITYGFSVGIIISAIVFYVVHFSAWLHLIGLVFLLSGTSFFQLVILLLSGAAGSIGDVLQPPSIDDWILVASNRNSEIVKKK